VTAYFIKLPGQELHQPVSKATFVAVERHCGFRNTMGEPDEPGTAGFGSPFADGRINDNSEPGEFLVDIDVENRCAAELEVEEPHKTFCPSALVEAVRNYDGPPLDRRRRAEQLFEQSLTHHCNHLMADHTGDHVCRCATSWT
jgi:hypothetical protein